MRIYQWLAMGLCFSAVGCASSASDIQPSYVSPIQYQDYSCRQIGAEAERISQRVGELTGVQDSKATNDAVATGIAVIVFWPAAFMIKGDGQTGAELARMKGEFETLQKVSIRKNCKLQFRRAPAKKGGSKEYKHNWSS